MLVGTQIIFLWITLEGNGMFFKKTYVYLKRAIWMLTSSRNHYDGTKGNELIKKWCNGLKTPSQSFYYENCGEGRMTDVIGDLTTFWDPHHQNISPSGCFCFPTCWLRKGFSWENIDDKDEWVSLLSCLIGRQIFGDADFICMIKWSKVIRNMEFACI